MLIHVCRITNFVRDKEAGSLFVTTFLSYLSDKRLLRNEGKLSHILDTISFLSNHIDDPLVCVG